jgi:hypothetical protein
MPDSSTRTVIVALPEGVSADWLRIAEILSWKAHLASVPYAAFLVRRGRLLGWISRWFTRHLLDAERRHGGVVRAAGGRLSRLDLPRLAASARDEASARWWAWHDHVASKTPVARPWEDFLAECHKNPDKLSEAGARIRFEAQPRVLAMLAYNSYPAAPHLFDPYRLDEYQGGEAVYVALYWQHAITGDALVTPDGRLLEPASERIADRLRYLAEATRVVHALKPHQHLVAAKAGPAPTEA